MSKALGQERHKVFFLLSRPAAWHARRPPTPSKPCRLQGQAIASEQTTGPRGPRLSFSLSRPAVWQPGNAPNAPNPPSLVGFRAPKLTIADEAISIEQTTGPRGPKLFFLAC